MQHGPLFDDLVHRIAHWQRRRLVADALLWLPRGLLAGLVAAAVVAALARFRPVLHNREVALITLGMALLGLLLSLLALALGKPSLLEQARFFDNLFGLQERASTAVELHSSRIATTQSLKMEQLADAALAASSVDVKARIPLRLHWRDWLMILLAATLLLMAVLLPNSQSTILDEQQALAETIAQEIVHLQAVENRIQDDPGLDDAGREALLEPIRAALDELATGNLSREEAVAALSDTEVELRDLAETGDATVVSQALQAAGQSLLENPSSTTMGQVLAGGELAQAATAANQLAQRLPQLPDGETEALGRDLAETATALAELDPALAAALDEAAETLQDGDVEGAQQALRQAAATLQARASEQAVAAQAREAAGELQSARGEIASAGAPAGENESAVLGQSSQGSPGDGIAVQGTESDQGASMAAGSDSQVGQGIGGPGPGGGHAETIYAPQFTDLSEEEGVEIQLPAECAANPELCGQLISESPTELTTERSLVPYQQVFGDYRDAAFEALDGDYIPLGMKGLVRDYFSTLEP